MSHLIAYGARSHCVACSKLTLRVVIIKINPYCIGYCMFNGS